MPQGLSKLEQSQQTRRAILARARQLFATKGYAATGTEEIIRELAITRGALYHQFGDKRGVLEAVIGEVYEDITRAIRTRIAPMESNWDQIVAGCHACLDLALQEDLRRLVCIEAPAFLPVDTLARLDQPGFNLLQEALQNAVQTGVMERVDAEGFAHLLNGSLNALASWAAQTEDPERLKTAHSLVDSLLQKMRRS